MSACNCWTNGPACCKYRFYILVLPQVRPLLTGDVRPFDTAHPAHVADAPPANKPLDVSEPPVAMGAKETAGIAKATLRHTWGW